MVNVSSSGNADDQFDVVRKFLHLGKVDEAQNHIQKILEIEDLTERQLILVNILKAKILVDLNEIGETQVAIDYTIEKIDKSKYKIVYIEALSIKAHAMLFSGDFPKCLSLLQEIEDIIGRLSEVEQAQVEFIKANIENIYGLIYSNQGQIDQSLKAFRDSYTLHKKLNHRKEMGTVLFNLANVQRLQNEYTTSISNAEDAITIFDEIEYIEGLVNSYKLMRDLHQENDDDDSSFIYKQKIEALEEKINFKNYKVESAKQKRELSREIERINRQVLKYQQENWTLKLEINSLNDSSRKNSFTESMDFSDELTGLKTQLTNLTQEKESRLVELSNKNIEIQNLNNKISFHEEQVNKLQNEVEELKNNEKELRSKLETMEENMNAGTGTGSDNADLEKMKTEHEEEKAKIVKEYEDKIAKLTNISQISSEFDPSELDKLKNDHQVEMAKLRADHSEELEKLKSESSKQLEELKKQAEATQKDPQTSDASQEPSELQSKLSDLKKENTELKSKLEEAKTIVPAASEPIDQLKSKLEAVEKENSDLKSKLEEAKITAPAPSEPADDLKSKLETLEKENTELKAKLSSQESQTPQASPDQQQEIDTLKSKTEELLKLKEDLEKENNSQKSQLKDQAEKITKLEQAKPKPESAQLKQVLEDLKSDFSKLEKEKEDADKSLTTKEEKIKALQSEVEQLKSSQTAVGQIDDSSEHSSESALEDLLASSVMAEEITKVVERNPQLKLRFIAMQIGTSPQKCLDALRQLENVGFLKLEFDGSSDSNPMIVKR